MRSLTIQHAAYARVQTVTIESLHLLLRFLLQKHMVIDVRK